MTTEQRAAESAIRALIENWAAAVHAGNLDGVLADHTEDIQMFDVPPPKEVRGIDAYRETWPPFFEWQKRGRPHSRSSRSTSPRVTMWPSRLPSSVAGRKRTQKGSVNRLRLTVGLRKEGGRWVVSHEHHSFPARD